MFTNVHGELLLMYFCCWCMGGALNSGFLAANISVFAARQLAKSCQINVTVTVNLLSCPDSIFSGQQFSIFLS